MSFILTSLCVLCGFAGKKEVSRKDRKEILKEEERNN
jgi:hypothetical protein